MNVEYIHRRAAEAVYNAWFAKKLAHKHVPLDVPVAASTEILDDFDATPFSISEGEGRLLLPDKELGMWAKRESTAAMVEEFRAMHFEKFMGKSNVCLSAVRSFLQGRDGTIAAVLSRGTPASPDDPSTPAAVGQLLLRTSCAGSTGKSQLHVTRDGTKMFMTVQTPHGVLQGQRVFLFGSGKYKTAAEMEEHVGKISLSPALESDDAMILFQDLSQQPMAESYRTVGSTISYLIAKGLMKEPLMPFHAIQTQEAKQGEPIKFHVTPTKERLWVSNRSSTEMAQSTFTTIGAALDTENIDREIFPNALCQVTGCHIRGPLVSRPRFRFTPRD